jgi:imidazole glycerol phosphate synthase glutamine amidotransferase subunit
MTRVAVIDSGVANLASVTSGFRALGADVQITSDPTDVARSSHVVLPGVGAFAAAREALRRTGLDEAVRRAHSDGVPLLGVCLGMQLLGEGSAESPGVPGLGIFPGTFETLPGSVPVPHLGWNAVDVSAEHDTVLEHGHAAFANSYCLTVAPPDWAVAWTTHGTRFVSALSRQRTLACQFHPELSGAYGRRLLERWLRNEPADPTNRLRASDGATRRIVPCLDVREGRVVKGVRFQELRDVGDPAEQAASYERQGGDEIVLLDIAASPNGQATQLDTVRAVRDALHIPLTVGGGVRTVDDARRLLEAGADKVSVNTAAVLDPALLTAMSNRFGTQCVVLAIDARRCASSWEVLVRGGRDTTGRNAIEWAIQGVEAGAGEILLTSWDRDGTRLGCDLELLRAVRRAVSVPIVASGGIGTHQDAAAALDSGADAVLAASVFHDGDSTVSAMKDYLAAKGLPVRQ